MGRPGFLVIIRGRPACTAGHFASGWRNRNLILSLTKREIVGRYRGSVFGLAWSFFNPLLMLAIYTFVFSVVFGASRKTKAAATSRSCCFPG
jgi:ABC-type polysaccharide/polyol phosphate export systems, permease component